MRWIFTARMLKFANMQVTGASIPIEERYEKLSAAEWDGYGDKILELKPKKIVDIACGLGRVSAYIADQFKRADIPEPRFTMCDSDNSPAARPEYGFKTSQFYNSFVVMFEFLRKNGISNYEYVDVERPQDYELLDGRGDVIISMLGLGFHVPLADCIDDLYRMAREDTTIILGIPSIEDMPDWEEEQIREDLFSAWEVVDIKPEIRTHQTRIAIIGGKI